MCNHNGVNWKKKKKKLEDNYRKQSNTEISLMTDALVVVIGGIQGAMKGAQGPQLAEVA